MQVHGVGHSNPNLATGIAHGKSRSTREVDNVAEKPRSALTSTGDEAKSRGVIRLLQAGHFKGVADVRLRINFFDELQALEHASLAEAAGTNVPHLLDAVNAKVDELLAAGELNEEQAARAGEARDTFIASVQQRVEEFQSGGGTNTQPPLRDIEAVFDEFVTSLEAIVTPPDTGEKAEPETPLDAVVADDAEGPLPVVIEEPETLPAKESVLDTFIADLRDVFTGALRTLDTSLGAATTLPPLSEPSGNGVAYAKFLAIYNDMLGIGPDKPSGAAETALDTLA